MLLLQREDGYAQLGLFVAANSLRILVLFAPNVVASVSLSLMNAEVGRGDLEGFRHTFWISLRTAAIVAGSSVLLTTLFSGTLMAFFGRAFLDGQTTLRLLLLAVIPEVLWGVFSQVLATHERMWTSLLIGAVPRDMGFVLLAVILVPRFGAAGVAAAYAASAVYSALAGVVLISRSGLARPLAVRRA
jgi:O-antigen/teichoic acid export membrane protein